MTYAATPRRLASSGPDWYLLFAVFTCACSVSGFKRNREKSTLFLIYQEIAFDITKPNAKPGPPADGRDPKRRLPASFAPLD
jgi:hypothetical protein